VVDDLKVIPGKIAYHPLGLLIHDLGVKDHQIGINLEDIDRILVLSFEI